MGYTTEFSGQFDLNRKLLKEHADYLHAFSNVRHMKMNAKLAEKLKDDVRIAVNLPIGIEGEYYVGEVEDHSSIIDYNFPPSTQPGLWCQWIPNEGEDAIVWDGGEKFYHYVEWMKYLIDNFLTPWDYKVNGKVRWVGEDIDDVGKIIITNSIIKIETF